MGRVVDAIPLFGSTVSNDKLVRLIQPYEFVYCWLDSDKYSSSFSIMERAQLMGKKSKVIVTELDPKYLDAKDWL